MKEFTGKKFPRWNNVKNESTFIPMSKSIKVKLVTGPDLKDIATTIGSMVMSTWDKDPRETNVVLKKDLKSAIRLLYRGLQGKFLPSAFEAFRVTFLVEGLSAHDLTHILRSRSFAFASDCTGDRVNNYRDILVPDFLEEMGHDYVEKYKSAMNTLMDLYSDSMNHVDENGEKDVSHLDARLLLPRLSSQYLYFSANILDVLSFIRNRLDRQIQPWADNIMALKMLIELSKKYPFIATLVNPDAQNKFYINESQTNFGSHYFRPNENNDVFPWKSEDFLYGNKKRDDLLGQKKFIETWNLLMGSYNALVDIAKSEFPYLYDEEFLKEWK